MLQRVELNTLQAIIRNYYEYMQASVRFARAARRVRGGFDSRGRRTWW